MRSGIKDSQRLHFPCDMVKMTLCLLSRSYTPGISGNRSHTTTRMTEHTQSNDGSKSPKEDLGLQRKASIRDSEHIDADKDERKQNKEKTRGGKARRSWRQPERPNAGAPEIALRFVF
ncbi:hypothetical protein F2Q69_00036716 [Brassica cretica]|uniref:Uncharacterized protein n=1 Tax=Brassica cretica TaxID=69181 RepID=A0A8S9SLR3_BRACR|nr:hypothetical protein F2Q69_00036716 [Brassica cretica]